MKPNYVLRRVVAVFALIGFIAVAWMVCDTVAGFIHYVTTTPVCPYYADQVKGACLK